MKIKSVEFTGSTDHYTKCPAKNLPEYAFVGRSNVGKSSLINALVNKKNIAYTSSKPGKTQIINHFFIDETWYLVDLPGYGYAKASKTSRANWGAMIHDYLLYRKQLACLFVLIDIRIKPQDNDLDFIDWLGENKIPFALVFTKSDKVKTGALKKNIMDFEAAMSETWDILPDTFITSSIKKTGQQEILQYINHINDSFFQKV